MNEYNTYLETNLDEWKQIFDLDSSFLAPFYFRGQKDSTWDLETSLERVFRREKYERFGTPQIWHKFDNEEKWMIHEFKRKFYLYSQTIIPNVNSDFEWLAIMQHYGAPTRLLDFTESIFIAAYFAVMESKRESVIWAVNWQKLRDNIFLDYKLPYKKGVNLKDEINECHINFANQYIAKEYKKGDESISTVIPLEPKLCNERLAKQQGLFLMPTNSSFSFMKNLETAFKRDNSEFQKISFSELQEISKQLKENRKNKSANDPLKYPETNIDILKIKINRKYNEIEKSLKDMNITAENLFPGLEGLAKSLVHTKIILY